MKMTLFTIFFCLCSFLFAGQKYSMKDLKALAEQGEWSELLEHSKDILPSERTAEWKQLVKKAENNLNESEAGGMYLEGSDGTKVYLVKDAENKKAYIKVENAGSEVDGTILLHDIIQYDGKTDFRMKWNGGNYVTLAVRGNNWWYGTQFSLSVPGKNDSIELHKTSKKFATEPIVQRFYGTRTQGKNAEEFKREIASKTSDWNKRLSSKCKAPVQVSWAWDSFKNPEAEKTDGEAMCEDGVRAILKICDSDIGRDAVKTQLGTIECAFSKNEKMQLGSKKLSWAFSPSSVEREVRVRTYLEKNLD